MDWMSHAPARTHPALPQLSRTSTPSKVNISPNSALNKNILNHNMEFVPRVLNTNSATSSPNFLNSFPSVSGSSTAFLNVSKKLEDSDSVSTRVTPEPQSPPLSITSSPILHEKLGNGPNVVPAYQENVGGTTYFYQYPSAENSLDICQPPENSPMVQPTPAVGNEYQPYPPKPEPAFFISSDLKSDMHNRQVLTQLQPDPNQYPDLPSEVDSYHELCPLEPITNQHKPHLGYQMTMYKARHSKSGVHYCLRRIHAYRLQNTKCMAYLEIWKKLNHSNIVQLKEVFTTKAFGDNSLILVYNYFPGSETLFHKHFAPDQIGYSDPFKNDSATPRPYSYQKNNILRHQQNNKLPEPLIWSYIIQLTGALRVIHASALACRSLDLTKIILTSKNRLRLSCLGTMDVVMSDTNCQLNPIAMAQHFQQEDLTSLGKLVLALACKSMAAVQRENVSTALDLVGRTYTTDLRNLIVYLLSNQRRSVTDLMPMIGARYYTQLDNLQNHIEVLDNEISREMQNGRLFRLMAKLATINERPDFNMETSWSETGDRYMLKLFRDYVFHQVTEEGLPWTDMPHIVQCLNKLDAGVPEKICLMSRDEQSVLVVSYAELKIYLEQSFQEIVNTSINHDVSNMEEKL